MSYRKITVDGKQYDYVVGKTHVKVRGMQAVDKNDVGSQHDRRCECCGETLRYLYGNDSEWSLTTLRVTPSDVESFIRRSA